MAGLDEDVHVEPHNPDWASRGRVMVRDISAAMRELPVDVAHIGSTAVPGLDAKPIIDIQVGSPDDLVGSTIAVLMSLCFEHLGQTGVPGREYLRRRSGHPVNVHVVHRHGRLWSDNILFRDYLRANPAAAARYAAAKAEAARQASTLSAYSALKAQTLVQIMEQAQARCTGG